MFILRKANICLEGRKSEDDYFFLFGKSPDYSLKFGICPYYPLNLYLVQFTPFNYFSWSSLPLNMIYYFFHVINFCDMIENTISYVRKIYLNLLPLF